MRLVHSFSPFEEICVLFDDDRSVAEISVWRENDLQIGALYVAQAVRFIGSGWFLDVGNGRSVYLNNPSFYLKPDGAFYNGKLTQGDRLIVRLIRSETSEKEAEVSCNVTLAGRRVVLMPAQKKPSFSRQLDQTAIERLKLLAPNEGVLFRTAAQEADLQEIASEIEELKQKWKALLSENSRPKTLYTPQKDVFRYAEKYGRNLNEIATDDPDAAARLKKEGFFVSFDAQGIWNKENLDETLDMAAAIRTPLPSGGFLITQQTAACVCFDVNAGSGHISAANEEACPEILRQIRLKGLGGQMIIDFAGRKDEKLIRRLIPKLKNENVFISGISTLGLVEMTVEKTRRSVFDLFGENQFFVRTAAGMIRRLWFAGCGSPKVKISAPADVLKYVRPYVGTLKSRLKADMELQISETLALEGIQDEKAECV